MRTLGIIPGILKLLTKTVGHILRPIGKGKDFLCRTPIAQKRRSAIDKWDIFQ